MDKKIRPFLKWPGRKFNIICTIKEHLLCPSISSTLVEPFLGSAAVFLNTNYQNYYLSDNNPDLINIYCCLAKEGDKFIRYSSKYFSNEFNSIDKYYELRERFNNIKLTREKAALFLYLNRHGYNGLCRYNSSGGYNVPFGSYKKTYFPLLEMQEFYNKIQTVKVKFTCEDFSSCLSSIKPGSVVYCDPPYLPLSNTSDFTKYSFNDFSFEHQVQLVEQIRVLQQNGIHSIISNHDTCVARELYHDAKIITLKVKRMISCKTSSRKFVKELLAIYNQQ